MSSTDDRGHAAPAVAPLQVLRIDHVGIAVADLEAAISFYVDVFGMRCVHTETNTGQGVREAMLRVGADDTGAMIQLLAPIGADSTISRFLSRRGPGMQQLAYTVADIDAASATLRAGDIRLLYDTARPGTSGSRVNFVHPADAGGVLVELVQPANCDPEPTEPVSAE